MSTPEYTIDSGHTAYILMSMALVQLMTPGLAFFYGGLCKQSSIISMFMQNFLSMGIVTVIWFVIGFSLCFGSSEKFLGNPTTFAFFKGVNGAPLQVDGETLVDGIPGLVFAGYQGMFAVITPPLMTGAFVHRVRVLPYMVFITIWLLIVYCPFCHWVWGPGGWMGEWGVKDFAGGIVVHITAGFSALASIIYVGPREALDQSDNQPHNIPFVALGTALLWFGWFGFNGGSALASGESSAYAAVNSEIAASTALFVWTAIAWMRSGKPSLVELCVGAVAGLATITPAAGFVEPWAAFVIGALAAIFCYMCVELKNCMKWDDALDVWGVHGMGGFFGTLMIGVFASEDVCGFSGSAELFGKQAAAASLCAAYSFIVSYALLKVIDMVIPLKPLAGEVDNLDISLHGEFAYGIPGTTTEVSIHGPLPGIAKKVAIPTDDLSETKGSSKEDTVDRGSETVELEAPLTADATAQV